jgi:COX assembly protein 2
MHPPLDRPHPDCQDVINALKACHKDIWKKFTGGCNDSKRALDICFAAEKKRQMVEVNKDWPDRQKKEQEVMKELLGKNETFDEFLARDPIYQREIENIKSAKQQD